MVFKTNSNNGRDAFSVYLLHFCNKILDSGYFPDAWSEGPLNIVNNFRGITLLSTVGKLFTRLLNTRLSKCRSPGRFQI